MEEKQKENSAKNTGDKDSNSSGNSRREEYEESSQDIAAVNSRREDSEECPRNNAAVNSRREESEECPQDNAAVNPKREESEECPQNIAEGFGNNNEQRLLSSPPVSCAICFDSVTNEAISDSCTHTFCFNCLKKWTEVRAVCPLCKKKITRIQHNVHEDTNFIGSNKNEQASTVRSEVLTINNPSPESSNSEISSDEIEIDYEAYEHSCHSPVNTVSSLLLTQLPMYTQERETLEVIELSTDEPEIDLACDQEIVMELARDHEMRMIDLVGDVEMVEEEVAAGEEIPVIDLTSDEEISVTDLTDQEDH